ncbi:MAG TPA: phosphatase PAP2-related protein [Ginsengibacter sp.]
MKSIKEYHSFFSTKQQWSKAFSKKGFLFRLLFSVIWIIGLLIFMRDYFQYIEARKGAVLNDWLLQKLPVRNFSTYIFGILYPSVAVGLLYLFTKPLLLLRVLETAAIVFTTRLITMYIVKLDPPEGIIPLVDSVTTHLKCGGKLITKDLFFSGHITSLLILYLAIKNRWLKSFLLLALSAVILMLLWQHVHYTIDILGAIFFTNLGWKVTRPGFFLKVENTNYNKRERSVSPVTSLRRMMSKFFSS